MQHDERDGSKPRPKPMTQAQINAQRARAVQPKVSSLGSGRQHVRAWFNPREEFKWQV